MQIGVAAEEPRDFFVLGELGKLLRAHSLDVDAHDLESLVAVFFVLVLDVLDFFHAGGAGARPEIDQHDLAAILFQAEILPFEGLSFQEHFIADEFQAADAPLHLLDHVGQLRQDGEAVGEALVGLGGQLGVAGPLDELAGVLRQLNAARRQRRRVEKLLHLVESFAKRGGVVLRAVKLNKQEPPVDHPCGRLVARSFQLVLERGNILGRQHAHFHLHGEIEVLFGGPGGDDLVGRLDDRLPHLFRRLAVGWLRVQQFIDERDEFRRLAVGHGEGIGPAGGRPVGSCRPDGCRPEQDRHHRRRYRRFRRLHRFRRCRRAPWTRHVPILRVSMVSRLTDPKIDSNPLAAAVKSSACRQATRTRYVVVGVWSALPCHVCFSAGIPKSARSIE